MQSTQNTTQYRRTSRHPSEQTKERISQALRGRPKDESWRQAISRGMINYWEDDNNFPDDYTDDGNGEIGMADIIL